MDPEMLLTSLGFAGGSQTDDSLSRVPDRFFLSQAVKPGADQYHLMVNHPELHHLIPVMGTSQLRQGTSHVMPETSHVTAAEDHVDSGEGTSEKRKGQLNTLNNINGNTDADFENLDKDIPVRFVNGNENNQEQVPVKSRILELCGIVPERYLITNSKVKSENVDGDCDTAALEEEERKSEVERPSNNVDDMPSGITKGCNRDRPQCKVVDTGLDRNGKISDDTLVVEVEIHDHSTMLDKTLEVEDNCNMNDGVKKGDESDTAEIGNCKVNGVDEVRRNINSEMEGLRSWSSTSSDSFDDPYLDLNLDVNETVV